jgi:Outer membrane protein beta-barrel domain
MEHVNNDMDDLFRKAGDQYPLKTSGSDWDGVLGKLREDSGYMANEEAGRNNKRRWGWLLLLIPLALGSVIYFSSGHKKLNQSSTEITNNNVLLDRDAANVKPGETNVKAGTENSIPQKMETSENIKRDANQKTNAGPSLKQVVAGKHFNAGNTLNSGAASSHKIPADGPSTGVHRSADQNPATESLSGTTARHTNGKQSGKSNTEGIEQSSGHATEAAAGSVALATATSPVSAGSADAGQKNKILASDSLGTKAKDSVSNTAAVKKDKSKATLSRGFYFGLFGGPNWNTIKFQTVEQTGVDVGILVGYRFSKRIAVESGFILDKSYYYSKGEYFNPSKSGFPSNEKVKDVTGNCVMFEIPVTFRYDFSIGKNHGFFANAGLSSYLMKRETYSANLVPMGGMTWTYPDTTYKNSTNNLFSVMQLSVGYERTIGQKTKIRIEPFVKIPLQGLGIGSMPISSAGIYFGITYSLK